jgi:hypothetical protein
VDRSPTISLFNCQLSDFSDSELNFFRSSIPVPANVSTWLTLYLQSSVLAQSFGQGRSTNIFDRIRSYARFITIESGVTIIQRHARNKHIYIIFSGDVSLICDDKSWSTGSGHAFGDFSAINGLKSICIAVTASKSSLIMIPSHIFCVDAAVDTSKVYYSFASLRLCL